jgi:hypothetical protein
MIQAGHHDVLQWILQQVSSVGAQHSFARLKGGTILIVGEERLVAAMIGAAE